MLLLFQFFAFYFSRSIYFSIFGAKLIDLSR